jgi:hypothetical protein
MTPEQFCYWLQGYCELNGRPPSQEEWESIKEHLQTVFKKVTRVSPFSIDKVESQPYIGSRPITDKIIC